MRILALIICLIPITANAEKPLPKISQHQTESVIIRRILERDHDGNHSPYTRVDYVGDIPTLTHVNQEVIDMDTGRVGKITHLIYDEEDPKNESGHVEVQFEAPPPEPTDPVDLPVYRLAKVTTENEEANMYLKDTILVHSKEGTKIATIQSLYDRGIAVLEFPDEKISSKDDSEKPQFTKRKVKFRLTRGGGDKINFNYLGDTSPLALANELVPEVDSYTTPNGVVYKKGDKIKTNVGADAKISYIFKDGTAKIDFLMPGGLPSTSVYEKLSNGFSNLTLANEKERLELKKKREEVKAQVAQDVFSVKATSRLAPQANSPKPVFGPPPGPAPLGNAH
jgi:hypothetical protein